MALDVDVTKYYAFKPADVIDFMQKHGKKFTKIESDYTAAIFNTGFGVAIRRCENCVFFDEAHSCLVVDGEVTPKSSCRFFLPKQSPFPIPDLEANLTVTKTFCPLGRLIDIGPLDEGEGQSK